METVLYHPVYGYYSGSELHIGRKGDFVTSPHCHELFGALLARQIEEFIDLAGGKDFSIVEIGAGAGYLAKDILKSMDRKNPSESVNYIISEPLPGLRDIQKNTLNGYDERVSWVRDIEEIGHLNGCIVSNELLDSFPVHVIEKRGNVFQEIYVDYNDNKGLFETTGDLSSDELAEYIERTGIYFEERYRTEANLAMKEWIEKISSILICGFVMTVDYGYTAEEYFSVERNRGTLLSYMNQQVNENFYEFPGCQDITSHVNFSDLHGWGTENGFQTIGYCPQWSFLAGLDIEDTFYEITGGKFNPFSPETAAIKMLILPHGMGSSHKVMVQSKGIEKNTDLKGFQLKNDYKRL